MENFPPELLLSIPVLLFSLSFHEFCHAWSARMAGDMTATSMGRLTLNPLAHIDLIGTILLPAILLLTRAPILFGWAKPVPVNPLRFKRDYWDIIVSLAGPGSNLLLIVVSAIAMKVLLMTGVGAVTPELTSPIGTTFFILQMFILINAILMLFNLIPIPPLDGSHVLLYFIKGSESGRRFFQFLEQYGFMIVLLMLFIGPGQLILGTLVNTVFKIVQWFLAL